MEDVAVGRINVDVMSPAHKIGLNNIEQALRLMIEEAGDRCFELVFINTNRHSYKRISGASWKYLIDRGCVTNLGSGFVAFTAFGWQSAMVLTLNLDQAANFSTRLSRLSAALKDVVKRERHPARINSH